MKSSGNELFILIKKKKNTLDQVFDFYIHLTNAIEYFIHLLNATSKFLQFLFFKNFFSFSNSIIASAKMTNMSIHLKAFFCKTLIYTLAPLQNVSLEN